MTSKPIKFGTDGWRAIIGNEFTQFNLGRVAEATADWITESKITQNGVIIGYDARFRSRDFAMYCAQVFASKRIKVKFADTISPTPAVSWAAGEFMAIGIVITASHNPPEYNGFKIKAPFGGPATPAQIREVEDRIQDTFDENSVKSFEEYSKAGLIKSVSLTDLYLEEISKKIDLKLIAEKGIRIAHDPMFGSGKSLIAHLLPGQVEELHNEDNPGFKGVAPEPIERNLTEMPSFVKLTSSDLGIANDGDADRVGMFDENGDYVDSHQILCLLTKYLGITRGMKGEIIKTFSTTDMLRKQAEKYGLPITTTPIGFKYIAEKILDGDMLVSGEESGGIAIKGHIPERDGIFIGLMIAEMTARLNKPLSALIKELFEEFGPHYHYRNDLHTSQEKKDAMVSFCENDKLTKIASGNVVQREKTDGIKHWLEDGSWLLVRPSGTEPVLRVYSEASTPEKAKALVEDVCAMIDSPVIFN